MSSQRSTVTVGTQLRFVWDWPRSRWWLNNGASWAESPRSTYANVVICPEVSTVISQLEIGSRAWRSLATVPRSLKEPYGGHKGVQGALSNHKSLTRERSSMKP